MSVVLRHFDDLVEGLSLGSFRSLPDWLVTQTGLLVLCIIVLTFVVLLLVKHINGEKQRREDYVAQVLHSASKEEKLRILSKVELVSDNFKRQEEILACNRTLKAKVDRQDIEISDLRSEIETLQCTLKKKTKSLKDCQSRCQALCSELREMDDQMKEKNKTINVMKKRIRDKDTELRQLKQTMSEKEDTAKKTVEELCHQLSEREKEIMQMAEIHEERICSLQNELEQATECLRQQESMLQNLRKENEAKDTSIKEMHALILKNGRENRALCEELHRNKTKVTKLTDTLNERTLQYKADMESKEKEIKISKGVLAVLQKEKQDTLNKNKSLVEEFKMSLTVLNQCCSEIQNVIDTKNEHERDKRELFECKRKLETIRRSMGSIF